MLEIYSKLKDLSPSGIALVLVQILALYLALSVRARSSFELYLGFPTFLTLSITEETLFVEMRIWCIKIHTIYALLYIFTYIYI